MKDLRKTIEPLLTTSGEPFLMNIFIGKWAKFVIIIMAIAGFIYRPEIIAEYIGSWFTNFFGTLVDCIDIPGVTSFNFLLILTFIILACYFINKWLRTKMPIEKVTGRAKLL